MTHMSTELHKAIQSATPDRLESVLCSLCNDSREAATLASQLLLIGSKKRKRYEVCKNCDEEFDIEENGDQACQFHPGEKEVDWDGDYWADHDEDNHGRIEDMEDEFPEGFVWSCCSQAGDESGCMIKEHIASAAVSGKRSQR